MNENMGSLRDFKLEKKDYRSWQGFQIGAKRFQVGAKITNWGRRDYKPGQGFQIGEGILNRCRTTILHHIIKKSTA